MRAFALQAAHAEWRRYMPSWLCQDLYAGELKDFRDIDPLKDYKNQISTDLSIIDGALEADQKYYLPSDLLFKVDAMSMAHGLDPSTIPGSAYYGVANHLPIRALAGAFGRKPKRLLRDALKGFGCSKNYHGSSKVWI